MPIFPRKPVLLAALGVLAALAVALVILRHPAPPKPSIASALSMLAEPPDWSALDPFQHTITRSEFETALASLFTTGEAWRDLIQLDESAASIQTGEPPPHAVYRLAFSNPASHATVPPRWWRTAAEMPPAPPGKPLAEVRIAIDPGHIGGRWAVIEERYLTVGTNPPVCEGDLTLAVAKRLKPRLEALGATVALVRETPEPLTPLRPESLIATAIRQAPAGSTESPRQLAERLFYRTAEIRARAALVNTTLRPDLVLCLHFNAEAWGSAEIPLFVDHSHLHLIVNGAYDDSEIRLADQRFALLHRLLQRTQIAEIQLGSDLAAAMAATTGLPPFTYPAGAGNVRPIPGQPYLWARNLLANRLYQCPVVFAEPYVMNSRTDYARLTAGDYDGLREIFGKPRPSIFREYTDAVAAGLVRHYTGHRPPPPPRPTP